MNEKRSFAMKNAVHSLKINPAHVPSKHKDRCCPYAKRTDFVYSLILDKFRQWTSLLVGLRLKSNLTSRFWFYRQ